MNIDTTKIALELVYPKEGWVTVERKCAVCKGYKTVSARIECEDTMIYCPTCNGSGTVPVECRVRVNPIIIGKSYDGCEGPFYCWGKYRNCSYEIEAEQPSQLIKHLLTRFATGEDIKGIEIKGENDDH